MIRLEVRRGSFNGSWTVDCVMHNSDGSQEFSERVGSVPHVHSRGQVGSRCMQITRSMTRCWRDTITRTPNGRAHLTDRAAFEASVLKDIKEL